MRSLILALLVFFTPLGPAQAQSDPVAEIINRQIAAFLSDDMETAFGFASPGIKRLFGTSERFGQMVREGYPMVYRPAEVTMLEQQPEAGGVTQRVMMRDASGRLHFLAYRMIDTPEGWQIDGVQLLRAPATGV